MYEACHHFLGKTELGHAIRTWTVLELRLGVFYQFPRAIVRWFVVVREMVEI